MKKTDYDSGDIIRVMQNTILVDVVQHEPRRTVLQPSYAVIVEQDGFDSCGRRYKILLDDEFWLAREADIQPAENFMR